MNYKNISPEEVVKDLQQLVSSLPETVKFKDFYKGGAGQTILEMLAGIASMTSHHKLMLQREASLQKAQLLSSVVEHGINKGFYVPAAKTRIIRYEITPLKKDITVSKGDILGEFRNKSYQAVFLRGSQVVDNIDEGSFTESLILRANQSYYIDLAVGFFEKGVVPITDNKDYYVANIDCSHTYLSEELEELIVDNEKMMILDTGISCFNEGLKKSVLRVPYENKIKLIFGNDIIGKRVRSSSKVFYQRLMFDSDVNTIDPNLITFHIKTKITTYKVIRPAVPYMDKDEIRFSALRNPIDGRIINKGDYESFIMRELSGYIYDIVIDETLPYKFIYILPNDKLTDELFEQFKLKLNSRRLLEDRVYFRLLNKTDEYQILIEIQVTYIGDATTNTIKETITKFKNKYVNRIMRSEVELTTYSASIELTELVPTGKFVPYGDNKTFKISRFQYISSLKVSYFIGVE